MHFYPTMPYKWDLNNAHIDNSLRASVRFRIHYKAIEVAFLSGYESHIGIVCFSSPIQLWQWSLLIIIKRQPYTNRNDACQMNETAP